MFVNARAIIQREVDGRACVYLQYRTKHGEPRVLELPGGRIEEFEPIESALRREVEEETGMAISVVPPTNHRRVAARTSTTEVECLSVYAGYQTVAGPIDSIGFYFLCAADGEAASSNESDRGIWMDLESIAVQLRDAPDLISWVDQAGLRYHLEVCEVAV